MGPMVWHYISPGSSPGPIPTWVLSEYTAIDWWEVRPLPTQFTLGNFGASWAKVILAMRLDRFTIIIPPSMFPSMSVSMGMKCIPPSMFPYVYVCGGLEYSSLMFTYVCVCGRVEHSSRGLS